MRIDNTQFESSLNDTTELRKLIIENPDVPLLVFAGEESWQGEWAYNRVEARVWGIRYLTLYKNEWLDEEDYKEKLTYDLCSEEEYKGLSDKAFDEAIDKIIDDTVFAKAIVIYVG